MMQGPRSDVVELATDAVTTYLQAQGEQLEAVYFERSHFFLGWRLVRAAMTVVYRLEQEQLIICDFSTENEGVQSRRAAYEFVQFVHEIKQNVKQVQCVKGTFFFPLANPQVAEMRRRWIAFLERQGAHWETTQEVDGQMQKWLVF